MTNQSSPHSENALLFLADHPVLDFLNTVLASDGQQSDLLRSDEDVLHWLAQTGLHYGGDNLRFTAGSLLHEARHLRGIVRRLVEQKKQGLHPDVTAMNHFLVSCNSYLQLIWQTDNRVDCRRVYPALTPAVLLAPLAEYAVRLLTEENFSLVRQCEHPGCILWFYDRTKGHRRRWCSMALCDNRAKVARYRHLRKTEK